MNHSFMILDFNQLLKESNLLKQKDIIKSLQKDINLSLEDASKHSDNPLVRAMIDDTIKARLILENQAKSVNSLIRFELQLEYFLENQSE